MKNIRTKSRFIVENSQNSVFLKNRLVINEANGRYDLNEFIFSNLKLEKPGKILDLGCGRGKQLLRLKKEYPRSYIVGVDISPDSIKELDKKVDNYSKVELVLSDMDQFVATSRDVFDCIMSVYALYYSKNINKLLNNSLRLLRARGTWCVVGPYGQNNKELFELIGYENISNYVLNASAHFMIDVIPFFDKKFRDVQINTMINPVIYKTPQEVLDYWSSSTFYDKSLRSKVEIKLEKHFMNNDGFVIHKHVMFIKASVLK